MGRPAGSTLVAAVPRALDGQRLDRVVAMIAGCSRSEAAALVDAGDVAIDGRAVTTRSHRVAEGDALEVLAPVRSADEVLAPDPTVEVPLVYEDPDMLVIDKPGGLVVHPGAGQHSGTLVHGLLARYPEIRHVGQPDRPGIVHRLDKGTSGVMVVAKHDAAHEALAGQFHDRDVEKEYVALVWGVVQAGRRIDLAIGRDPHDRQKMSARARRARSAVTRITRAEHLRGVTLCHVAIATGRTHQIRVHLSAIGHPIVGDATYGGVKARVAQDLRPLLQLDRPFLHAWRLTFTHPTDGRPMSFEAPLPEDLQHLLDRLREVQSVER